MFSADIYQSSHIVPTIPTEGNQTPSTVSNINQPEHHLAADSRQPII